ncbi:M1 family metallopeptidase [Nonlabens xiamenensis]|uniref:M1 family metallopeptidase n=1 Tax=Nonlabens xiamenensis TaxID=2341043 RepID=UPI000F609250|nr:M1 family metallopeptidase [Nonlabens xiamenensis]
MKWIYLWAICSSSMLGAQNMVSQTDVLDFQQAQVFLELDPNSTQVKGRVIYDFKVLQDTDSFFLDAKNLIGNTSRLDEQEILPIYDGKTLQYESNLTAGSLHQLELSYTAFPSKALYHVDTDGELGWDQVWTQGQGKYTSNWLPSLDDMKDKIVWNLSIAAPKNLKAIANGKLVSRQDQGEFQQWNYSMELPMSSYLVAFAVGNYAFEQRTSTTGVPIELYYYPDQSDKVSATYRYSREIFDFLEQEIGVAYPWQNYKQVPVKDFLYSGMENTSLTLFNDQFLTDDLGSNDRSYVNVNAHELAHQWFGNLVTETDSKHHWLHEGFASYYALLAERELYGNAYFQVKLYEYAEALNAQSSQSATTALLDPAGSTLTYYQHGAWALHALRNMVGEARFRESVSTYLQRYAFKNVTTDDFLQVVTEVTGKDLTNFKKIWLTAPEFPTAEALVLLRKDPFMEAYLQVASRRVVDFDKAFNTYQEVLEPPVEKELVKEVVAQLSAHEDPRKYDLLRKAILLDHYEVNQLIALSTPAVNDDNRDVIRQLLRDPSYVTREAALFLMWNDVDNKRTLLDDVRDSWQQWNPSLQMAWRVLALNSRNYKNNELLAFMSELQSYTSPEQSTETRTAAFEYLISLRAMGQQNYVDLIDASLHHVWRFYEDSRKKLIQQYQIPTEKALIDQAIRLLGSEDRAKIEKILGKN